MLVEQHDLASDALAAEMVQFVRVMDNNNGGDDSIGGSGDATTQCCDNHLLGCIRRLPWKFDQLCRFHASHPVWNHHFFHCDFQSQVAHLFRDVFGCLLELRGTA